MMQLLTAVIPQLGRLHRRWRRKDHAANALPTLGCAFSKVILLRCHFSTRNRTTTIAARITDTIRSLGVPLVDDLG